MNKIHSKIFGLFYFYCCTLNILQADVIQSENSEKKHHLSICTIFKNEANHLKEWIEYHRIVGVDHFYLYNLGSTDSYKHVLKPYIDAKLVTLIEWKTLSKDDQDKPFLGMLGGKIPAYENAVKYLALNKTTWLSFVNVDEFLVPPTNGSLLEILEQYKEAPGVTLMSDFFDASKINSLSSKKLVIENTRLSLPIIEIAEKQIEKTIFKPDQTVHFTWPPYKFAFKDGKSEVVVQKNQLRINQYTNRELVCFYNGMVKDKFQIDQRTLNEKEKNDLLDRYELRDQEQIIRRFIPDLRKKMGFDLSLD
jgi:hypothetical protein